MQAQVDTEDRGRDPEFTRRRRRRFGDPAYIDRRQRSVRIGSIEVREKGEGNG